MIYPRTVIVLIIVCCLPILAIYTLALASGERVWFTDNMDATASSTAVTVMEQALLDRINGAISTIDVTLYDFNRDSIRDALIVAHDRGVTVRVVTDDDRRENATYIPYFQALETAGIEVKDDDRSSYMHNKYFVIDGELVWTGSTNLTDNGFTKNHNDGIVFTSTELADIYLYDFEQMWGGSFGTAKVDSLTTTMTYEGDLLEIYFSPEDDAMQELIAEVDSAAESIEFAIFFLTHDDFRDALIAAHERGVAIRGLWDVLGAGNLYSDDEALCTAGVSIKIEDTAGKMHHKFMVIDADGVSPRVITGSMNWSASGDERNDENTLIIHSGEVAQAYATNFDVMWDGLEDVVPCNPEPEPVVRYEVYMPLLVRP